MLKLKTVVLHATLNTPNKQTTKQTDNKQKIRYYFYHLNMERGFPYDSDKVLEAKSSYKKERGRGKGKPGEKQKKIWSTIIYGIERFSTDMKDGNTKNQFCPITFYCQGTASEKYSKSFFIKVNCYSEAIVQMYLRCNVQENRSHNLGHNFDDRFIFSQLYLILSHWQKWSITPCHWTHLANVALLKFFHKEQGKWTDCQSPSKEENNPRFNHGLQGLDSFTLYKEI